MLYTACMVREKFRLILHFALHFLQTSSKFADRSRESLLGEIIESPIPSPPGAALVNELYGKHSSGQGARLSCTAALKAFADNPMKRI